MPVIVPSDTSQSILQLLADPKAVKANIAEMQSMSEQLQRDTKKATEELSKLSKLEKDLAQREASLVSIQKTIDNRELELKSYEKAMNQEAVKYDQRMVEAKQTGDKLKAWEQELTSWNNMLVEKDKQLKLEQDKVDAGWVKLAASEKEHQEWRASISSILSSKP